MTHHRIKNAESGNALWFILLAIALLVALTITVTRSSDTSQETGSRDRNRIMASDILKQMRGYEQAVEKLRLTGLGENNISFESTNGPTGYANAKCTDNSCRIFHPDGAGLNYNPPQTAWLDPEETAQTSPVYGEWYVYGRGCVPDVGTGDATCASDDKHTELILLLPWIRKDLCFEINRLVGVTNPGTPPAPPLIAGAAFPTTLDTYQGEFLAGATLSHASLNARKTGCFQGNASDPDGGYHAYHVLIAR